MQIKICLFRNCLLRICISFGGHTTWIIALPGLTGPTRFGVTFCVTHTESDTEPHYSRNTESDPKRHPNMRMERTAFFFTLSAIYISVMSMRSLRSCCPIQVEPILEFEFASPSRRVLVLVRGDMWWYPASGFVWSPSTFKSRVGFPSKYNILG